MPFIFSPEEGSVDLLDVPGGWAVMEDEGIVEANPETGPSATVRFHLYDSADRYSFVQQLLGTWSGTPTTGISYVGPYAYPPSPNLICTSVPDIRGLGKPWPLRVVDFISGQSVWPTIWIYKKECIVTAVFTRPPWQAGGYFSLSFNATGNVYNIPGTAVRFPDGTPDNERFSIPIPTAQITVTRHRMPFIPDAYAMQLLTTVNATPFEIGWNIYPAGTLLFYGMNTEVEAQPFAYTSYQCQYIFQYRQVPWNMRFHPDGTSGWQTVTDGAGHTIFGPGDFTLLP